MQTSAKNLKAAPTNIWSIRVALADDHNTLLKVTLLIEVNCPNCNKKLKAPQRLLGKRVGCRKCQKPFVLASPSMSVDAEIVPDLVEAEIIDTSGLAIEQPRAGAPTQSRQEQQQTTPLQEYTMRRNESAAKSIQFLFLASWFSLVGGALLPVINVKKRFWIFELENKTFSILGGIQNLASDGHSILAFVILLFSIVMPTIKLMVASALWGDWSKTFIAADYSEIFLSLISLVSKWSMLDVFVVAVLIVICKISSFAEAEALFGIYLFGFHVLSTMALIKLLEYYDHERSKTRFENH